MNGKMIGWTIAAVGGVTALGVLTATTMTSRKMKMKMLAHRIGSTMDTVGGAMQDISAAAKKV